MYLRKLIQPFENESSFFLFGPRGTGKSTWLRAHFNGTNAVYLDLLDDDLYTELLARPHRLESLLPPTFDGWVILDEVQRIPALLSEVHRLIADRGLRFALTGSSARSLRRKGINLLAGRALTYHMYPLTAVELGDDFDLGRATQYGQLPSIPSHAAPKEYLKAYVRTYLREEVLQEGLIRNLASFARFLEAASFSQATPINIAEISRDCALDRKTIENYFGILEDLLIGLRLPVFTKRAKRRLIAHPKFFFFDAGVYRAIRPMGPLDSPEEADGACLETLCLQELRAINDLYQLEYEIFYWRTTDGTEVDFILYGPNGLLAFEVKRASKIERRDLTGLRSFKRDYPMAKCHLLYGGSQQRSEGDITVIPIATALRTLPELLLPS